MMENRSEQTTNKNPRGRGLWYGWAIVMLCKVNTFSLKTRLACLSRDAKYRRVVLSGTSYGVVERS